MFKYCFWLTFFGFTNHTHFHNTFQMLWPYDWSKYYDIELDFTELLIKRRKMKACWKILLFCLPYYGLCVKWRLKRNTGFFFLKKEAMQYHPASNWHTGQMKVNHQSVVVCNLLHCLALNWWLIIITARLGLVSYKNTLWYESPSWLLGFAMLCIKQWNQLIILH